MCLPHCITAIKFTTHLLLLVRIKLFSFSDLLNKLFKDTANEESILEVILKVGSTEIRNKDNTGNLEPCH